MNKAGFNLASSVSHSPHCFCLFKKNGLYLTVFLSSVPSGRECSTARCAYRQPGRHCRGWSRGSVCVPFAGGRPWWGWRGGRWPPFGQWAPHWLTEPRDRRPVSSKNPSFLFKVDLDGPQSTPQHGYDRQHRSEFFSFWAHFRFSLTRILFTRRDMERGHS